MFQDKDLLNYIETNSSVQTRSSVIAEWNMNIASNIKMVGNYRYRPTQQDSAYRTIPNTFDPLESSTNGVKYYTGATDADIKIDGGFDDEGIPTSLYPAKDKMKMLYSLENCFSYQRPRSGINKATYLNGKFLHNPNINMAKRPRYYMPDKKDPFKYWTSFRTESGIEYGVANKTVNGKNRIEDACPFVVYKEQIPANRIVVKMQTNTGELDYGIFSNSAETFLDPYFGENNRTTPNNWKIQVLKNNSWVDAKSFSSSDKRKDGTAVIGSDGYVELSYGLIVPSAYLDTFNFIKEISSVLLRPVSANEGDAFLVVPNSTSLGTFHIWSRGTWKTFTPTYGWSLEDSVVNGLTSFVTDLTNPPSFVSNNVTKYKEFEYISGIRIVVDSMNKFDSTFDLIEISPRLTADLSDRVMKYSVNKSASDLGVSGLPVGQLLASTGSISLFDFDDAFHSDNTRSIISRYVSKNIQIKLYEVITDTQGIEYYMPIKTMYADGFPKLNNQSKEVSIELRDLYFYFESQTAPQMLLTNASVSSAVSILLDSIGFSNYVFKRVEGESEVIIPYFFIPPEKSVAKVLEDIAISTQTAMFFDEYNNFVMMSKDYIMPSLDQRPTDLTLYGTTDFSDDGVLKNKKTNSKLSNIIEITSQDNEVYNDGKIVYTTRYIQRSLGSIKQASLIDNEKTWIYKPVLLWEVQGTQNTKSINGEVGNQSTYMLSAIPLNSNLSASLPSVKNNRLVDNIMDLGEGVYWITRYNGYFYSNGEIIKYDAVQYNISGTGDVWINNVQEYDKYFSSLPFNGKIYPTGLVRIYAEPNYEEISGVSKLKNGPVSKHGRGQFGTPVSEHGAGLNPYWSNNSNVRGCTMQSKYLFDLNQTAPATTVGPAGINNTLAQKTSRNGIIKNFLASKYISESEVNGMLSTQAGTVQSSALVMNGPGFTTTESPVDFVSYVYKKLENKYKHFGTRMRIVGKVENDANRGQTPVGASTYFTVPGTTPEKSISIVGGSGGLAVMINPESNNGYYFEIIALGANNLNESEKKNVNNVMFYKVKASGTNAIPIKLYEGLTNIVVDDGRFTGQYRMSTEENPTVFDLSVEYQDIGTRRRFFLYINNNLIATVDDEEPLPAYNNMALFVRGSSRVMFENIYALANNYSQNTAFKINAPIASAFGDSEINANDSFMKYAMSGVVQGTYLAGISSAEPPAFSMYFEEFGTIMREAASFNIKYDKAYPALYAKLSPTFNRIKGYAISGFTAGSYGAEFLVFNSTDTALSLDESSGNYLRIQGITFTQESDNDLTVDEYFSKNSNLADPETVGSSLVSYPFKVAKDYEDIKLSRMSYGKKDFSIEVPYIQSHDAAENLMSWVIKKIMKPRRSMGVKIFANPMIQLGDIVSVDYIDNGIDMVSSIEKRFVVYNIEYTRENNGPSMTVFLSEVV
jgi:ribosomal protein S6E (S10)